MGSRKIKVGSTAFTVHAVISRRISGEEETFWLRAEDMRAAQRWSAEDTERTGMTREAFIRKSDYRSVVSPWQVIGDGVIIDARGREVCTVDSGRNLDDAQVAAIAAGIAASPDLRAAARDVLASPMIAPYRLIHPFSTLAEAVNRAEGTAA